MNNEEASGKAGINDVYLETVSVSNRSIDIVECGVGLLTVGQMMSDISMFLNNKMEASEEQALFPANHQAYQKLKKGDYSLT